jgi:hypothetical protein
VDRLLGFHRPPRFEDGEVVAAVLVGRLLREQVEVRLAEDFFLGEVKELLEPAVDERVAPLHVFHVDHGRGVVQDGLEALSALAQGLLGRFLLRYVPLGPPNPDQPPVLDDAAQVVQDNPLVALPVGLPALAVP